MSLVVAVDWVACERTAVPSWSTIRTPRGWLPYCMSTSTDTGHAWGLKTRTGWVATSIGMSTSRAMRLWARVMMRLEIATASPS